MNQDVNSKRNEEKEEKEERLARSNASSGSCDWERTSTRRRVLKAGVASVVASSFGVSASAQGPRGRGQGRFADASTVESVAADASTSGFPYHLDGCKTFSEYKQGRKRAGRPCDAVVVEPTNPSLQRDESRCANCGRCDEACMAQTISHWYDRGTLKDGVKTICVNCGQCATACKFNVLHERLQYSEVRTAASDPSRKTDGKTDGKTIGKTFVATTAPALRVSLGEMFGLAPGANLERQIVAALREIGFDRVFDAAFGADLTTEEEARELLARLDGTDENGALPLFTSCCPAWVKFVETFYPEFIPNLSTTRSPLMSQGAAIKTKFAQDAGLAPESIVHVAFVPCVGKKFEATRPEANAAGRFWKKEEIRDLDFALTTRELASWLFQDRVDPTALDGVDYDSSLGEGGGAGKIFGATGGVAESVLRTLWKLVEGSAPPAELLKFEATRGLKGMREASVKIGERTFRVAVVNGLAAARPLLETLKKNGKLDFDFVEVMACSGGCVGGGGQPKRDGILRPTDADRQNRADGLFAIDAAETVRTSADNEEVRALYKDFAGESGGERAEELFHTAYKKRDVWK